VKSLLPWAISGGLLAYVLIKHDMGEVSEAFAQADLLLLPGLLLVFVAWWLVWHSLFIYLCLRWVVAAPSPDPDYNPPDPDALDYKGMLRATAASYVLHILSFVVGLGGLVVYFKRRYGVAYSRGTALMLMSLLHAFCALGLLAWFSIRLIPPETLLELGRAEARHQLELASSVGAYAAGFYLLCVVSARVWNYLPQSLRNDETIFTALTGVPLYSYPVMLLIYLVQMASFGVFVILAMPAFGVHPPALASMALTQVVMLARGLPISSLGIGLDQVTFSYMFKGMGEDGAIVAFSIAFTFGQIIFRFLIGLPFFTRATKEMFESPRDHADQAKMAVPEKN